MNCEVGIEIDSSSAPKDPASSCGGHQVSPKDSDSSDADAPTSVAEVSPTISKEEEPSAQEESPNRETQVNAGEGKGPGTRGQDRPGAS